jgi:catechol 2,3-dioxygenase-like lactoylglutathione lyase family enzyme
MINHLSIGVRDVARSGKFYDAALKPLGYTRLSDGETSLGYGDKQAVLWVQKSDSPVPDDMASGLHFCFDAPSRKSVDAFYKAALAAGGKDNGPAGLRVDYGDNYYAAFVIDPDGYRLEAYCGKAG